MSREHELELQAEQQPIETNAVEVPAEASPEVETPEEDAPEVETPEEDAPEVEADEESTPEAEEVVPSDDSTVNRVDFRWETETDLEVPEYLKPELVEIEDEENEETPFQVQADGMEGEFLEEGSFDIDEEAGGDASPEEDPAAVTEEIVFRDIPRKRKVRKQKHIFLRAFTIMGVLVIIALILLSPLFNIKKIQVEGNIYYTDKQVINMSGAKTGQNIFLHAGAGEIEDKLIRNPYYKTVSVHRRLPSTLVIEVDERPQVASLQFGDKYVVIDDQGLVLRVGEFQPKLTLLKGLTLSKIEVGEKIEAEERDNLSLTLDMLHTMDKGDLYFKEIQIGDLNIQAYIYDMLMVKGRPSNVKKAILNGDLQKVVNKLYKSKTKRGVITVGDDDYLSFSPAFS